MRQIYLISLFLPLFVACTSSSDSSSSGPVNITDTAWAGECTSASQGTQRAVIAYSAGSFSVRTFLFLGSSDCSGGWDRRTAATTGNYVLGGTTGVVTDIDISNLQYNDSREKSRHDAVIPRSYDVYYIENGLLYYGDYSVFDGSSSSERPITYALPAAAEAVNIAISDVF